MIHDLINISRDEYERLPLIVGSLYSAGGRLIKVKGIKDTHDKHAIQTVEKYLNTVLGERFGNAVAGFRHDIGAYSGRSIFEQVRGHLKFTHVLKLDIKDFYESLTWDAVSEQLTKEIKLDDEHLKLVEELYFHRGHLARGLMNAPLIAECFLLNADNSIRGLAYKEGLASDQYHYSRYYDDFFVSSDSKPALESIQSGVEELLTASGLSVNQDKTKIVRTSNTKILGLSFSAGDIYPPRYIKQSIYKYLRYYDRMDEGSVDDLRNKMSACGTIKGSLHYIINNSTSAPAHYSFNLGYFRTELSRLKVLVKQLEQEEKKRG